MSNLEHDDNKDVKAPRTKRKYTRRKPVSAKPAAQKAPETSETPSFLAGITPGANGDCCIACDGTCIITGDICGHPHKSGIQPMHKMKPDVLRRYNQAKQELIQQKAALSTE